ncbi:MAG: hypothetical protein KC616_25685, partial [Myxococcales bacterium]|nr:hypothetical protein [Myxococcales bacterium]
MLSSITARRRAGAVEAFAALEGVTVTDCERTLRPRTVAVRAATVGAGGGASAELAVEGADGRAGVELDGGVLRDTGA